MAKILLIKIVDTGDKHTDDLIGTYESTHVFSELEETQFTILNFEGIERQELMDYILAKVPETKTVYKTGYANEWCDSVIKARAWQDGSDWKLLEKDPKYMFSFSDLTVQDRKDLESKTISKEDKLLIIDKIISRIILEPENSTIITIRNGK